MTPRDGTQNETRPHEDRRRMYRIGRWVTDCRLARGWTMVDVAMRLHATFPHSHLGNQGRISELETGNGVNRSRWTEEILQFLESIFQPCSPLPAEPWAFSEEWEEHLREREAAEEARRREEAARREGVPQLGLELAWPGGEEPRTERKTAGAAGARRPARAGGRRSKAEAETGLLV